MNQTNRKVIWLDLETTGLSAQQNEIVELAMIYNELNEDNGIENEAELHLFIKHDTYPEDYPKLAEMTGLTEAVLATRGVTKAQAFAKVTGFLRTKIDSYDRDDKAVLAGFNVGFDDQFMREFFTAGGSKYYGSFIRSCRLDVMTVLAEVGMRGQIPFFASNRLEPLCQFFEIDIDAHSAMSDIKATRELYRKLVGIRAGEIKLDGKKEKA